MDFQLSINLTIQLIQSASANISTVYHRNTTIPPPYLFNPGELLRPLYAYLIPILVLLCALSSSLNLYILLLTAWIRKPLFPIVRLTLSLAAADFVASLCIGSSLILNSYLAVIHGYRIPQFHDCICLGLECVRLGSIMSSILHLLLLAINHYIAIAIPHRQSYVLSDKLLDMLIIIFWLLPPIGFFVAFSSIPQEGFQSPECSTKFFEMPYLRVSIICLIMLPLCIMVVLYCLMIRILHQIQNQFKKSQSVQRKRKAMITTLLMIGSFLVGWLPGGVFFLLAGEPWGTMLFQGETGFKLRVGFGVTVNTLIVLKLLINPMIYAVRIPEIEEAFLHPCRKFTKQMSRREELDHLMPNSETAATIIRHLSLRQSLSVSTRSGARTSSLGGHREHSICLATPNNSGLHLKRNSSVGKSVVESFNGSYQAEPTYF